MADANDQASEAQQRAPADKFALRANLRLSPGVMRIRRALIVAASVATIGGLYVAGCTSLHASNPIKAQVVDATTCEPIADASVVVSWGLERPRLVHGADRFTYKEMRTTTDQHGRFTIAGWGPVLVRGYIPASFPQAHLTKQGFEDTVHYNYFSGFDGGTVCNDQYTEDTSDWFHDSVMLNVTWNGCALAMNRDVPQEQNAHNKALQATPSRCALGRA